MRAAKGSSINPFFAIFAALFVRPNSPLLTGCWPFNVANDRLHSHNSERRTIRERGTLDMSPVFEMPSDRSRKGDKKNGVPPSIAIDCQIPHLEIVEKTLKIVFEDHMPRPDIPYTGPGKRIG